MTNLQEFACYSNNITEIPKEIKNLVNLLTFSCSNNYIKEIPTEIGQLVNLQYFFCNNNQITEIPREIKNLVNLQNFTCSYNEITELPEEIGQLVNLKKLVCHRNKISSLPKEIGKLFNLENFFCFDNKLTKIPKEIGSLVNLYYFACDDNQITEIPIEITNCGNLEHFQYSNNPIEYIPPQVQRWFDRNKTVQKIYNDSQSVHNHAIQQGITNSINYIMQIKPSINNITLKTEILSDPILDEQTKQILLEYCDDKSIHTVLNITFEELLISVYDFALKHKHKENIFAVLNTEMQDSLCKCFTGRISRLINCLNGFDNNIIINISDAEQIGNICIVIREKLGVNYTEEKFKELVKKELQERNYDENIIAEWLDNI